MMLNNITLPEFCLSNSFWVICKKLPLDLYVLYLVTVAMLFHRTKIPTVTACKTPEVAILPSFKLVDLVVSEKKIFENLSTMTTTDTKWWHKLTWPLARWANNRPLKIEPSIWQITWLTDYCLLSCSRYFIHFRTECLTHQTDPDLH